MLDGRDDARRAAQPFISVNAGFKTFPHARISESWRGRKIPLPRLPRRQRLPRARSVPSSAATSLTRADDISFKSSAPFYIGHDTAFYRLGHALQFLTVIEQRHNDAIIIMALVDEKRAEFSPLRGFFHWLFTTLMAVSRA